MQVMMIVANWKAYVEQTAKAKALMAAAKRVAAKGAVKVVIAPPAPYLGLFATGKLPTKNSVILATQDVSDSTGGAATGEVTSILLSEMGVSYAIIGHSERRAMGESDELVFSKVQHALAHGISPIVCIGERERDSEAHYLHFLRKQIASVYAPLDQKDRMRIVLAYEPIWAIGKSAAESITPHDLQEMILYIRKVLGEYLSGESASAAIILYGGSVEPENIRALAGGGELGGFLIGHASVDVATFTALAKAIS